MINKIVKLLEQLEPNELRHLHDKIKADYSLGELWTVKKKKEKGMLRDDIRDKVLELILENFQWTSGLNETDKLVDPEVLDSLDVVELSSYIEKEFDLDFISPDDIFKWNTVVDIVNYIEDHIGDSNE